MNSQSHWTIAVGASGSKGLQDLRHLLNALSDLDAVVMIVLHRPWAPISYLREVLQKSSSMPVLIAEEDEQLHPGRIYIGEPASHLTLIARTLGTKTPDPTRLHGNRTVDLLFNSIAEFGVSRIIGIVLAGSLDDGSRGLAAINHAGGHTMVVTPGKSPPDMPSNAISYDGPSMSLVTSRGSQRRSRTSLLTKHLSDLRPSSSAADSKRHEEAEAA